MFKEIFNKSVFVGFIIGIIAFAPIILIASIIKDLDIIWLILYMTFLFLVAMLSLFFFIRYERKHNVKAYFETTGTFKHDNLMRPAKMRIDIYNKETEFIVSFQDSEQTIKP